MNQVLIFVLLTFSPAGDVTLHHEVLPAATCANRLAALERERDPYKLGFCTRPGEDHTFRRVQVGS